MPLNRNKRNPPSRGRSPLRRGEGPPEVMTRSKAIPVLVVAALFDALRFMFEWFIFFGPALAGLACTVGLGGSAVAGAACTAGAAAGGFFGSAVIGPFGIIMAEATGLTGWLVIGLILVMTNSRIFKENALWFGASLLLSEIPFLGSLPFFTGTLWKMYSTQIRVEKAAYKKWQRENAALDRQERDRQALQQSQALQVQQAQQQSELDNEWQDQMNAQKEQETAGDEFSGMQFNQPGAEDEEETAESVATRTPYAPVIQATSGAGSGQPMIHEYGMQQYSPPRPETKVWSPSSSVPPPLTEEYGYRRTPPPLPPPPLPMPSQSGPPPLPEWARAKTPPPLPPEYLRSIPPPLPIAARATPPPLPIGVPNFTVAQQSASQKENDSSDGDPVAARRAWAKAENERSAREKELREKAWKETNSSIQEIDSNLSKDSMGEEGYKHFIENIKNLPPDGIVHLYHGLKFGGYESVLEILNSPSRGVEQHSGPTFSLLPIGQFWRGLGFRYSLRRDQIAFPGEDSPDAVVQMSEEDGVEDSGRIVAKSGNLPLDQFEAEIMRSEYANPNPTAEKEVLEKLHHFAEARSHSQQVIEEQGDQTQK